MKTTSDEYVKKLNRMGELEQEAENRFFEKSDFDRTEWMLPAELEEYITLYKDVNGECPTCGEVECEHGMKPEEHIKKIVETMESLGEVMSHYK
jgi:hypothetical protein